MAKESAAASAALPVPFAAAMKVGVEAVVTEVAAADEVVIDRQRGRLSPDPPRRLVSCTVRHEGSWSGCGRAGVAGLSGFSTSLGLPWRRVRGRVLVVLSRR